MGKVIKHNFKNKTVQDLGTCTYGEITDKTNKILLSAIYHKSIADFKITYYDSLQQNYITINMSFNGGE